MAKRNHREKKVFYSLLVAALAVGCGVAIHYGNYPRAAWTGSFAVAVACWIIAVLYPVTCGVTTRQGRPCRNPSNSVLFGCDRHTWIKFWARFGRRERVQVQATASAARAEPPYRSAGASDSQRGTVLFWLAIVATGAGFISMTTDVIGLFDRAGEGVASARL